MRYLGGKSKIASRIAAVILSTVRERDRYIETCIGGGAVFEVLAPHFARPCAGDVHPDLMLMWQAVARGWVPPTAVTEEQYRSLKNQPSSALRGFVGFGCSFAAKWFATYARDGFGGAARNFAEEASCSVVRMRPVLERALMSSGTSAKVTSCTAILRTPGRLSTRARMASTTTGSGAFSTGGLRSVLTCS